jgi:hypothetical protein
MYQVPVFTIAAAKKKEFMISKQDLQNWYSLRTISIFFYIRIWKVGQTLFQCGKSTFLWPEPEDFHNRVKRGYETREKWISQIGKVFAQLFQSWYTRRKQLCVMKRTIPRIIFLVSCFCLPGFKTIIDQYLLQFHYLSGPTLWKHIHTSIIATTIFQIDMYVTYVYYYKKTIKYIGFQFLTCNF